MDRGSIPRGGTRRTSLDVKTVGEFCRALQSASRDNEDGEDVKSPDKSDPATRSIVIIVRY